MNRGYWWRLEHFRHHRESQRLDRRCVIPTLGVYLVGGHVLCLAARDELPNLGPGGSEVN